MAVTSRVQAVFGAYSNGLVAGTKRAATSLENLSRSVSSLQGGMRTLVGLEIAGVFSRVASSVAEAVGKLQQYGAASAVAIDKTSKLAQSVGAS